MKPGPIAIEGAITEQTRSLVATSPLGSTTSNNTSNNSGCKLSKTIITSLVIYTGPFASLKKS